MLSTKFKIIDSMSGPDFDKESFICTGFDNSIPTNEITITNNGNELYNLEEEKNYIIQKYNINNCYLISQYQTYILHEKKYCDVLPCENNLYKILDKQQNDLGCYPLYFNHFTFNSFKNIKITINHIKDKISNSKETFIQDTKLCELIIRDVFKNCPNTFLLSEKKRYIECLQNLISINPYFMAEHEHSKNIINSFDKKTTGKYTLDNNSLVYTSSPEDQSQIGTSTNFYISDIPTNIIYQNNNDNKILYTNKQTDKKYSISYKIDYERYNDEYFDTDYYKKLVSIMLYYIGGNKEHIKKLKKVDVILPDKKQISDSVYIYDNIFKNIVHSLRKKCIMNSENKIVSYGLILVNEERDPHCYQQIYRKMLEDIAYFNKELVYKNENILKFLYSKFQKDHYYKITVPNEHDIPFEYYCIDEDFFSGARSEV